ncbi:hypothetical protein O181_037257 [Austropuccinia psidii MF-1]|uniref:Reverse transcriptase domain-containing protein n=1 Tax=Austropuccinia psidii MF-1 TaxID=1389203 RepID=A0A9Q3D8M6_9BASI|nr:hypothetical protein [Austropuccinia psidii MF-1]
MLKHQSQENKQLYYQAQEAFRNKVEESKRNHWKEFLAEKGPEHAYQAYRFTKERELNTIAPFRQSNGKTTTDANEMAKLLFAGTSINENTREAATLHQMLQYRHRQVVFPEISKHTINIAINNLPNKKPTGPDSIPNEMLKVTKQILTPHLAEAFNKCLKLGRFPPEFRESLTTILRKAAKDDYSEPKPYRPIALLNTTGKLFKRIINHRLVHWAETIESIAQGHMGGRQGRNINDALLLLTTWMRAKWREGKVVAGMFLDVKSAYPTVDREKLIAILRKKKVPPYIIEIIISFLSNRHTQLWLNEFISKLFPIKQGLPQGSPLSVTLYLIYNSSLLLSKPLSLKEDQLLIAYIVEVAHLTKSQSP